MKNLKKVLALVLAVVMIMGTVAVASAKDFKDVKATDNYAEAIDVLSNLGIIDGFTDGEYKPEGYFTRAQAAKMVAIVHNAATNGKIKGQDGISALYGNAQNAFTDCTGNWAVAYINYCRATGLLDGITRTTYAPNSKLTGVQWLKLMLTTLNFDTSKEGYLGAGWDVNVLNRANELDLLAGLADGWKGNVPVTRGEAAQILYNTLTAYLVEYGQNIKGYKPPVAAGRFLTNAFVANETVEATGVLLATKMGVGVVRSTDAFRRPGYTWSHGTWSKFYMDTPKAEYKTAVTECEVLKTMGVAETSDKKVTLNGFVKGIDTDTATTKATDVGTKIGGDHSALNYYAVDGFKYTTWTTASYVELQHDKRKTCQTAQGNWKAPIFGGQGDLTQVFQTEDGWVVTVIHTFLANVEEVYKNDKYSHATGETAKLKVYVDTVFDGPVYSDGYYYALADTTNVSFAKDTKVLVTSSFKKTEATNTQEGAMRLNVDPKDDSSRQYVKSAVVTVAAAEAKTGKLTGASDAYYPESVSIDGTKYPTNCRFVLGKEAAINIKNNGKTFTFYFDTYGNVIGRVANTDAKSYVVLDRIYATHENGKFGLKADMFDLDGKAIEGATVAIAGSFASAKDAYDKFGNYSSYTTTYWNTVGYNSDNMMYVVSSHNDANLTNALYSYTKNDKDVYTLTWVGDATSAWQAKPSADDVKNGVTYGYAFGRLEGSFVHTAKLAYIRVSKLVSSFDYPMDEIQAERRSGEKVWSGADLSLSESTKFVVKSAGGAVTTYTGYTALPALTASYVDYLDNDNDGFADIVYIGNAVFAADNVTGWVLTWEPLSWENGYDLITVYVDGEPVTVNVKHETIVTYRDGEDQPVHQGLYTFTTKVDANGVTYSDFYKAAADAGTWRQYEAVESYSADATAIKVKDIHGYTQTIGLTDVVIYNVLADGTVVKADASCIHADDPIFYTKVSSYGNAPYAVIYVLDQLIPYQP